MYGSQQGFGWAGRTTHAPSYRAVVDVDATVLWDSYGIDNDIRGRRPLINASINVVCISEIKKR